MNSTNRTRYQPPTRGASCRPVTSTNPKITSRLPAPCAEFLYDLQGGPKRAARAAGSGGPVIARPWSAGAIMAGRPRRLARTTDSEAPGRQVDDVGALKCGAGSRPGRARGVAATPRR